MPPHIFLQSFEHSEHSFRAYRSQVRVTHTVRIPRIKPGFFPIVCVKKMVPMNTIPEARVVAIDRVISPLQPLNSRNSRSLNLPTTLPKRPKLKSPQHHHTSNPYKRYTMSTQFSATAPLVGRHKKNLALVGFDPLCSLSSRSLSSTTSPEDRQGAPHDVTLDLRMIASQLELSSPRRVSETQKKEEHEFTNSSRSPRSARPSAGKLPWQKKAGHRKTRSLASVPTLWNRNSTETMANTAPPLSPAAATRSISNTGATDSPYSHSAGMIHDLMELQFNADAFCALSIPGLAAKPRPTSFLTGQEVVRVSEVDATAWQVEIPAKAEFEVCTRVAQFLESYEKEECLLDLTALVGLTRLDLNRFARGDDSMAAAQIAKCHRPLVESLLECSDDLTVQGFVTIRAGGENRQALILESKRQFLCVFRGTPAEQQGKFSRQPELVKMGGMSVFADRLAAVQELETRTFDILDKLTEENPFCDVIFTGHSYGAAMATLAARLYASARPELRIAVLATACPKVGDANFRLAVHSLPNLKVMRVEYGNGRPMAPTGCQVGHTIRIHPSVGTNKPVAQPVKAYKFGDATNDPLRSLFKREKDVSDYVRALESLQTWVQYYHRQDGAGVKGKDNEARQMV
jgi:hypothetical protein